MATLTVVAVPAATIRLLHGVAERPWFQIDYDDLAGWLQRTNPTDAIIAIARLAALALGYYLLVSTLLYLVALTSGSRSLIRLARPFAIPVVRSFADRLIAGSIALGTLASPLLASSPPPDLEARQDPVVEVAAGYLPAARMVDGLDAGTVPAPPSGESAPPSEDPVAFAGRPTTSPPASEPVAPTPAPALGTTEVVVREGDHLWGLAEARLAELLGRLPLEHELAPYWRQTVDENRSLIRSGNPDLIHPGEVVVLPDPRHFFPH